MNTDNEQRPDAADGRAAREWLSFNDLQAMGVLPNWQTLRCWQKDKAIGFPVGRLFGPNTRRWRRDEIEVWLASRPLARAGFEGAPAKPKPRRGKRAAS